MLRASRAILLTITAHCNPGLLKVESCFFKYLQENHNLIFKLLLSLHLLVLLLHVLEKKT